MNLQEYPTCTLGCTEQSENPPVQDPQNYRLAEVQPFLDASNLYKPNSTRFLGVCQDGFPMLVDLTEKVTLAIIGDVPQAREKLYHLLLLGKQTRVVYAKQEEDVLKTALLVEDRSFGRRRDGQVILLIKDPALLECNDNVWANFQFLAQSGPALEVLPLISLSSEAALRYPMVLREFHTRIYGQMPDKSARLLSGAFLATQAMQAHQFVARSGSFWLYFWLPTD